MTKNILQLILVTLLFVQCSSPTKKNSKTVDYASQQEICCKKDSIKSSTVISEKSEITCPKCGHEKIETLPTEVCVIKYTCENCKTELTPKGDDCCVYCTYGTHKCPSKQDK